MTVQAKLILRIILLFSTHFNYSNCFAQQNKSHVEIKDSVVKTFYDADANVLSKENVYKAKYYRVIKYKRGNIEGPVTDYYMNGKPMMIGYYSNNSISKGNENGEFTWYYENGTLFQTCSYENGLLEGKYMEFYPSGLKKICISYSKGKRYGCEYAWDEEGTVTHRAFAENDALYSRIDCDTTYVDKASLIDQRSIGLKDVFLQEYRDGEYKSFDGSLFYKSKKIKILSVTLFDDGDNIITSSTIKHGRYLSVRINITGLICNNNQCQYSDREQNLTPDGKNDGGGLGNNFHNCNSETTDISLIGSSQLIYDKELSVKDYYIFFYIQDANSDAEIHGFYKYKLNIQW